MAKKHAGRFRSFLSGIPADTMAIILVSVFLLCLCAYVYGGITQYNDAVLRYMTTIADERDKDAEGIRPITPSVAERAAATFRDYPRTMLFLTGLFLALSLLNRWKQTNLQATLCALFLLLGIGCSSKVMYQGFYGITGEAGFIVISCIAMLLSFFLWRRMNCRLPTNLYYLLAGMIVIMIVLNILAIIRGNTINGAANWVSVGGISIQPSEFIKVGLVLLSSCSMRSTRRKIIYLALAGVSCLVVALAGDIGTAAIIAVLFFVMVMVLFDEEWISISLLFLFLVAFFVIVRFHPTAQRRFSECGTAMTNTRSVQQRDFIIAIVRGGWLGLGMENAIQFFQITAGGTDGVIGGIQAIFGMPMLLIVIGCYIILVLQCGFSRNADPSSHPILLQTAIIFSGQALLNYLGSLDVLPFTGITAPLLSQGGTSTLCTMTLMGIMCASLCSATECPAKHSKEGISYAK